MGVSFDTQLKFLDGKKKAIDWRSSSIFMVRIGSFRRVLFAVLPRARNATLLCVRTARTRLGIGERHRRVED